MRLITALLLSERCKTRKQAQEIIKKADEASIKLSGVPFGIPTPK